VRQRKAPAPAPVPAENGAAATPLKPSGGPGVALKLVLLVALVGAALLAYITSGERAFSMKALSAYDGSNEALPVYISIDGVVYDVSANRRVYGKGGSYNMM
jgi:hypothetical protein